MTDHEKLTELLKPVVEFIKEKGFHHMILIGKDGVCARYLQGSVGEISNMLEPLTKRDPLLTDILQETLNREEE